MSAYSFLDVSAVIDGPGGNFSLTGENDQEGISIEPVSDQNTMTEGADGNVMHSLSAGSACTATIRLLKTSPLNAKLNELYKYQTSSAAYHGQNTITIRDSARGDDCVVTEAAFKKLPANQWAAQGNTLEWAFDGGKYNPILGSGVSGETEE